MILSEMQKESLLFNILDTTFEKTEIDYIVTATKILNANNELSEHPHNVFYYKGFKISELGKVTKNALEFIPLDQSLHAEADNLLAWNQTIHEDRLRTRMHLLKIFNNCKESGDLDTLMPEAFMPRYASDMSTCSLSGMEIQILKDKLAPAYAGLKVIQMTYQILGK